MDIVNSSLPRGSKFYPIADALRIPLSSLLDANNLKVLRNAKEIVRDAGTCSDYWSICESSYSWVIPEGDEQYPIIQMSGYMLARITQHFCDYTKASKSNYVNSRRLGYINAAYQETIKVQYDPLRGGIWLHDVEYEGELVSNKPMVINKNLKSTIKAKIGELALEALIGAGDEDLKISDAVRYTTKAEAAEEAAKLCIKILSGDYETTELASCAVALGLYGYTHSRTHGWVINMDAKRENIDFDITASARTKLIYHLGGYNLPENYQEWFDG